MALQTDGLKLFLSQVEYLSCLVCFLWLSQYVVDSEICVMQGFGSTCDGLGGRLSPRNGAHSLLDLIK